MKTLFEIAKTAAIVILCVAMTFRLLHWPGGGIMTLAGAGIAAVAALLAIFAVKSFAHKALSIFAAVTVIIAMVGLVFRLLHWPGGTIAIILGLGIMLPVCAIWHAIVACRQK